MEEYQKMIKIIEKKNYILAENWKINQLQECYTIS